MAKEELTLRVARAAEAALARQQYVSLIDVLGGMGLLSWNSVAAWRKGRIALLFDEVQGSPAKLARTFAAFHEWARAKELRPSETRYARRTPAGEVELRFTEDGDPMIDKLFKTHFVSSAMPERKQKQLEQKLGAAAQPVVFKVLRDSKCSGCDAEIEQGELLLLDAENPLCLKCAGLSELVFLSSGDAMLTRRATKYSAKAAVVVRFSRSRGRYERIGTLVESGAFDRAEKECAER